MDRRGTLWAMTDHGAPAIQDRLDLELREKARKAFPAKWGQTEGVFIGETRPPEGTSGQYLQGVVNRMPCLLSLPTTAGSSTLTGR